MRVQISQEEISKRLEEISKLGLKKGFDLSAAHIVITDENANIIYANKAVESNTKFSPEEIIGKNPGDFWGGKMPKSFYENMWHTIKVEKKPFAGEVQNVRKDGTLYWQELLITPILDERGEIRFFIGIEPNISEKKKQDQFRDQFISALGHQTRNPLITIRWILENLLTRSGLGEAERQELEKVYQESQNLTNLVNDLLILSRVENLALETETIHLDKEIENGIEAVKKKQPNVLITFENDLGAITVNAVKSLVLQVLMNIMYNAAEHASKEQGIVTVKLQKYEQGALFSCYNNGESIPEEIRPRIFTKVVSTTGGAGLGLFIVKMICEYFGWKVWFDTGEGGTIFYVQIPYPNQ
jgi:PAS domain S-box-containing protein